MNRKSNKRMHFPLIFSDGLDEKVDEKICLSILCKIVYQNISASNEKIGMQSKERNNVTSLCHSVLFSEKKTKFPDFSPTYCLSVPFDREYLQLNGGYDLIRGLKEALLCLVGVTARIPSSRSTISFAAEVKCDPPHFRVPPPLFPATKPLQGCSEQIGKLSTDLSGWN